MIQPESRIYLDNAATSWPKPPQVIDAISQFYLKMGSAAGRGSSSPVADSSRILSEARLALAGLLNVSDSNRIVFSFNATDALNLAIHGLVRPNDHVVTSVLEHNSILRPLRFLGDLHQVETTYVGCQSNGQIDLEQLSEAIKPNTRLVCVSYVSNVTGVIQPIDEICRICRERNVFVLVDAAQAVGHLKVDIAKLDCDLLACAGHKGLLGPLGTGFLVVGSRVESELKPVRQGGTGSQSEDERQPSELPDRFESGNQNVGGIAGLLAGVRFVESTTVAAMREHACGLSQRIRDEFTAFPQIKLYPKSSPFPEPNVAQTEIVSFSIEGVDSQTVSSVLAASFGIQVRAGLHCAPRMHQQLGSLEQGGTVRVSPGFFNTIDEISVLVDAIEQVSKSFWPN